MRILKRLQSYCSLFVIRAILMCCVCAPVMVQAQLSGVYTIDNRLPTSGRNFNSFNAVVIALSGGITSSVTFNVAPGSGPYIDQLQLDAFIGTSPTKLLTFNGNGATLRFLSTNNQARAGIKLDGTDYVTIDNLNIEALARNNAEFGVGVHLCNDADHNIIRNCTINVGINTSWVQNNEGIVINGAEDVATTQSPSYCDSNQIINNTITGGYTGVTMSSIPVTGYPVVLMKGNQVLNNKISGYWNTGIYLLYNDGSLIQGNEVSRLSPANDDCSGITLYEGNINMNLIGNRIHALATDPANTGSRTKGIEIGGSYASATTVNTIANNLIYDFQGTGSQDGIYMDGGSGFNIYHNTISLENKAFTGAATTSGIYTNVFALLNVMNNIITVSRTNGSSNYGFNMRSTIAGFTSDRNLYFISGSTGTNAVGYSGGSQTTLASWQTKTGKDLLSVSSDPVYSDPNNFVLIPTDKNIDNLGQYAGIQNDFAGAVRHNTHPDIGAYEFLTPTCVGPAVGGTTTMLPGSPVCEGSPMAMNLSGNSFGLGQTYQWQTSSTINGTYTNTGAALAHPATNITAVSTLYYRVAVTCGTQVDYSVPVQVTVTPSLPAATYTINSAVATGGTNFQTFNDAINAIRCGIRGPVVFNVVDNGTPYREQVIIPKINGSSATNTVTFKGNGATIALATGTSAERAVIKLNGASWFIFDNLKVNPEATTSGYGVGFQIMNDADHNTIKNCTITMSISASITDLAGICITPLANSYTGSSVGSYCDSNVVTGNTIIGGNYGITCTSNDNYPSEGNVFTNNIIKETRQYGIWISNTRNSVVEGNELSRPARTANFASTLYWIYVDRYHSNLRVSKNKLHDPFGGAKTNTSQVNGIFIGVATSNEANPVIVSNNLLYNFQSSGTQNGLFHSGGDNIQYYHNTVSLEDATGTSGSSNTTRAFNCTATPATNLTLKNNILVVRRGGTGTKHVIYIGDATTTFTSDTNLILNSSTAGTKNYLGRFNNTDYITKSDWETNSGQDKFSFNVHPNWANATTGDFTPTEITLDNKGTPVGITTDINNKTRRLTRPDIGAIEFKVCLLLGPGPNVRVTNETTTSVSYAWDAVTNATGYVVSTDGVNYVQPSSGTTGLTHTISGLTPGSDVSLYVAAMGTADDCDSAKSQKVIAHALCSTLGAAPVVKIDTATVAMVQFSWTATPGASGYKVSTDGLNYVTPSSGATGLTHTITTGITPNSDISLTVQAQGLSELCPKQTSLRVTAHIPGIKYFVPNTFTPNRNGRNDYFTVQSYAISTMHLMIFNQWGEKIYESSAQKPGWDGTFNGKQQPVGVYVYVLTMTMQDGTVVNKKGTVNLIR